MHANPQMLWQQVLDRLQQRLSRPTFETWIQPTQVEYWQGDRLVLRTPNAFVLNHLTKHYLPTLREAVLEVVPGPITLELCSPQSEGLSPTLRTVLAEDGPAVLPRPAHPSRSKILELNPKYTFSRFVVGPTNRMAHAASLAVAESPGRDFNPLFLCGGVGLGKTHLMQAIGHYRLEMFPDSRVFYVSTEQFTNDLIAAIRNDNLQSFREHYRTADILLVDDIQFIEGKEYTQEEFFYTFNTLHEAGKQVVLASDRPPHRITRLQERLSSRFAMGLIADVQAPDLETRMAILQKKAEYENLRLPREVVEYIATHYTANIRELEGALIRTITYASLSGVPLTVDHLAPLLNPPTPLITSSPDRILQAVAEVTQISIGDLKGSSRRRDISTARQIGMYIMRRHTDLSLPRIGEAFGGKDHTTVLYSCEKIEQLHQTNHETRHLIRQIADRLALLNQDPET